MIVVDYSLVSSFLPASVMWYMVSVMIGITTRCGLLLSVLVVVVVVV